MLVHVDDGVDLIVGAGRVVVEQHDLADVCPQPEFDRVVDGRVAEVGAGAD